MTAISVVVKYVRMGVQAAIVCHGRSRLTALRFGLVIPANLYAGVPLRPATLHLERGLRVILSDRSELEAFREVMVDKQYGSLPTPESGVIVDCGANVGLASVFFRQASPRARIIAVEADARTVQRLSKNVETLGVEVVHSAVAEHNGTVLLHSARNSAGSSLAPRRSGQTTLVPATTLERLLDDHGIAHVALLKLDIEGAEFDALASPALDRVQAIIAEVHYDLGAGDERMLRTRLRDFTVDLRPLNAPYRYLLLATRMRSSSRN
jgi:FkbM family methyltransferase